MTVPPPALGHCTNRPVIVLAPDSFKESLTAAQVCAAMRAGLQVAFPQARFVAVPMADGGEGTVQSLVDATAGRIHHAQVTGPLGETVQARYGVLGDGRTAVIEIAEASGLALVDPPRRNPMLTTTVGTGELIGAALDHEVNRLVIGLGGSATNDAGAGMAQALGARLLDRRGDPLPVGGAALADLARIDVTGLDPRLADVQIEVACDVTSPLCGPRGASAVFGPQKGATRQQVAVLDSALGVFAEAVHRDLGRRVADVPGAGAAGGLGAGLLAFTPATLCRGVDLVIAHTGLAGLVAGADLVVTGEGRLDGQTRYGKTPSGVAKLARRAGVPVIAIVGSLGAAPDDLADLDGPADLDDLFDAVLPVLPRVAPWPQLLADAAANIERTCRHVGRLLRLGSGLRVVD